MIGKRLRLARAAAGVSLRELASGMNSLVTAQAIGKYERDQMMPSSTVLIALARALGVSEEYLLYPTDIRLLKVEFRKQKITSAKENALVRARVASEVERYLDIEVILGLDASDLPVRPKRAVRSLDDAEEASTRLRIAWKLGNDPIPDLCELLEEKGIKVCAVPLPEKVSGVQASVETNRDEQLPVIIVNANHPGDRQRFTVAHELGHIWLDLQGSVDPEQACHRFAASLLIPADLLRRELGRSRRSIAPRELFDLKRVFGVSAQAILRRATDLGIIGHSAFRDSCRLFNARGWRVTEPVPIEPERPTRFERLCIRALAEGLISESKASELLQKTVREINEILDAPPPEKDRERAADL